MLTAKDAVQIGLPPAMKGEYVLRILDAIFGASKSSGNPMVTIKTEVVGVPQKDLAPGTKLERGDGTWVVAGIKPEAQYFPLVAGPSLGKFQDFLRKLGLPWEEIDDQNYDTTPLKSLLVRAIVTDVEEEERGFLTEAERAAGEKVGKSIIDSETGKPIKRRKAIVTTWLGSYNGTEPTTV